MNVKIRFIAVVRCPVLNGDAHISECKICKNCKGVFGDVVDCGAYNPEEGS
jgi:hypothetical protein